MTITYVGTIRGGKIELDKPVALPEGSQVIVLVAQLDEQTARRKANTWLANYVGNVVGTQKSGLLLQLKDKTVWQFQVFVAGVTYASPIGPLGKVEIDADSGQVLSDEAVAQEIIHCAQTLIPNP